MVARARWKTENWIIEFCFACVGSTIRNSLLIYFNAQIIKKNTYTLHTNVNELISTISKANKRPFDRIVSVWSEDDCFRLLYFCVCFLFFLSFFFLHLRRWSRAVFERLVVANKFWCEFIFLELWVPFCFDFVLAGESRMHAMVQCALRSTGLARFRWNGISHGMHVYGVSMRTTRVHQRQNQVKSLWLLNGQRNPQAKKNQNIRNGNDPVCVWSLLLLVDVRIFSVLAASNHIYQCSTGWSLPFLVIFITHAENSLRTRTFTCQKKKTASRRGNNYQYIDLRSILVPVILF